MLVQIKENKLTPDLMVMELSGRITLGRSCQELEWAVKRLSAEYKNIIFDMAGVERIDSAGIGIVALSAGKLKEAGGELCVAGARGMVADVVKLTRMDTIVRFFPSVEEARTALESGGAAAPAG